MLKAKTRTVQFALVTFMVLLFALILPLIGSIHSIHFLPSRALDAIPSNEAEGESPVSAGSALFSMLLRVVFFASLILLAFHLLASRHARRFYLVLALLFGGLILLTHFVGCDSATPQQDISIQSQQPVAEASPQQGFTTPQPETQEAERGNTLYILLAVALSSVVVGIGAVVLVRWLRRRPAQDASYEEILGSLSTAANRLRAGEDPYAVVLFCYQEMVSILGARGKIDTTFLTPREFEGQLRGVGLSGEHTTQLTSIFEVVRYGGRIDDDFATRALACLDAIQEAHVSDES
jgi:hypothetical protein